MEDRLRKYARLAVQGGVHLQKGQTLMIHADVMAAPFVRMVTEEAYACGAREVVVRYGDEQITRLHYLHQSQETLCQVHDWELESRLDYLGNLDDRLSWLPVDGRDCFRDARF